MSRIHVPVGIRFNDLDAYGHVNNAAMLTLLEEARIAVFWSAGGLQVEGVNDADAPITDTAGASTITLVARQEVEYLAPIPYLREPIDVQLWIGKLGGASLDVCYEVYGPAGQEPAPLYARATTTIVLVDAATERPRKINEVERTAWTPYLEPTVAFTRK